MYKRIIPERQRCDCGRRVLNHHWLCDSCYSKKQKKAYWDKQRAIARAEYIKKRSKNVK